MIQLDFFEKNETRILLEEIRKVRDSSEKVRKSVFKRISEFEKMLRDIEQIKKVG